MKSSNYFAVDGYEVRFLQSAPVTVCVIRSLKNLDERYVGVAVCNPHDEYNEAAGRHKALKKALMRSLAEPVRLVFEGNDLACDRLTVSFGEITLPEEQIKRIQKAYWEHYKDIE